MSSDISITPGDFRSFIAWEAASRDTIDFKKIYVDVAGDLKAGLLLSQILYWRLPSKLRDTKLTVERENRMWLAKADGDWYAEVRLSAAEARSGRLILEERGLITCRTWKFFGNTTTHISINEERFLELMAETINISEEVRNAGRMGEKVKRPGAKKAGSKPASGNRKPRAGADAAAEVPADPESAPPVGEVGNYKNHNSGITETIIPELSKPQSGNYADRNPGIMDLGIPYTETPAETSPENPSEIPSIHPVTGPDQASAARMDDEGSAEAGTTEGLRVQAALKGGEALPLTGNGGVQVDGTKLNQAASLPEVPGGAAAALAWAIPALVPVPRAELERRPERDPLTNRDLRALMSCSRNSADRRAHLEAQLALSTPSGIPRRLFNRLTDDELAAATLAAQHDAGRVRGRMASAGYYALERLIGENVTPERLAGETEQRAGPDQRGRESIVTGAGASVQSAPPQPDVIEEAQGDLQPGALWRHKTAGYMVRITGREALDVVLDNGERQKIITLTSQYELVTPARASA